MSCSPFVFGKLLFLRTLHLICTVPVLYYIDISTQNAGTFCCKIKSRIAIWENTTEGVVPILSSKLSATQILVSCRRVRRRAISVMWLSDVAASTLTTRHTTRPLLTTSPYLSAQSKTLLKVCCYCIHILSNLGPQITLAVVSQRLLHLKTETLHI